MTSLTLKRFYFPGAATVGVLQFDGLSFCTLELPWRGNERNVSCVPQGDYTLQIRRSPLIKRITGGHHLYAWQVMDVPCRSFILFHPGNFASDTEGCILIGESVSMAPPHAPKLASSRFAYDRFAEAMRSTEGPRTLSITQWTWGQDEDMLDAMVR